MRLRISGRSKSLMKRKLKINKPSEVISLNAYKFTSTNAASMLLLYNKHNTMQLTIMLDAKETKELGEFLLQCST